MTLPCGNTTCSLDAAEGCCWDNYGLLSNDKGSCVTGPVNNDNCNTLQVGYGPETRIDCQSSAQCSAGAVCCGRRVKYYANQKKYDVYDQVTCESTCSANNVTLCIPNVTVCPLIVSQNGNVQTICKPSQLLPSGYFVCGNP